MRTSDLANYKRALLDCEDALNRVNLHEEEGYTVRFAIFSANLTNFLPEIPPSEHAELFKSLLTNLAFESFERNLLQIGDFCDVKGNIKSLKSNKTPQIFCTFHLGSYRIIANLLIRMGHNFSTIVRQDVYSKQIESMMSYTARMKEKYDTTSEVSVLNAEDPQILLKLVRELKSGRSLLVYLDGNTGTGDEKLDPVDFLSQKINARKGMTYLSYITGVPLVPVVSYRKPDRTNMLYAGEAIKAESGTSREEFSTKTLQYLFDFFAKYVASYPEQWEGWNYIHNALISREDSLQSPPNSAYKRIHYEFNFSRYSIFELQDAPVLFDKILYSTYEISDGLKNYLLKPPFVNPKQALGKFIFKELVRQGILI
jgi:KDO2-lipid IV(A) lauroyltransferase